MIRINKGKFRRRRKIRNGHFFDNISYFNNIILIKILWDNINRYINKILLLIHYVVLFFDEPLTNPIISGGNCN